MTRSRRIKPVHRVAENREKDAVRRMGESQQQLAAQQARLEELRAYRDQYARRFTERGGHGLDAMQLQDYRVFLGRLNDAIQHQERVIEQCRSHHDKNQAQWIDTHSHAQAIDKLIQRFRRDEQRIERQREQRALDEHAQRKRRSTEG